MAALISEIASRSVIGSCASPVKVKMIAVRIAVIELNLVMLFVSPVSWLFGYGALRIVGGGGEGKRVNVSS